MAFPCVKRNVISFLPLLVLLSITPLSSSFSPIAKVTKELLNKLCSVPPLYSHFCIRWLSSDPTTFTLDLNGLLGLVVQKMQMVGYKNLAAMKELAKTNTDPKLNTPYWHCVVHYETAIYWIDIGFLSTRDYLATSQAAVKAFVSISLCEYNLQGHENVPSDLTRRNLTFKRMCNIGRVFSDLFSYRPPPV
ncbi:hypothetical protein CARUB_v10022125mg [Capsella rubella]|uniref:Pectinesterase inhibitor domain-containing protein n=1 Tax=Capsella rubella TaxID=81985 RepID=R0I907_9BRAS|nr:pectinesterase inhibitor [Capsella rubella]EOA34570.1 hypothetical protein CARUB_v10022125mg [Capsella rubella]